MTKNFPEVSHLPTFHPVRMETTFQRAEARLGTPAALAARRAAWLHAQGLPAALTKVSCSQCGREFKLHRSNGFSCCTSHKGL
jgi:hypothetical protein